MTDWQWIRFAGLGIWKEKPAYTVCSKCKLNRDGKSEKELLKEIDDMYPEQKNSKRCGYAIINEGGKNKHY